MDGLYRADGVDGKGKSWSILGVMRAVAKASTGLAILAALLLGGCSRAELGVSWLDMDAGTGDTEGPDTGSDSDSDVDSDSDSDSDCDTDSDSVAEDGGMDAGPVWRFAAFCDSRGTYETGGHNHEKLSAIATAALADGVDLVIFPGDLVFGSGVAENLESQLLEWRDTMKILYDAGVDVYPVRGNHDDGAFEPWNAVFTGPYAISDAGPEGEINKTFAVEHENALFVGFDLYFTPHRVNQEWLDERLAETTAEHIFAFAHEPAYAAYHADCLDDYPDERDAFIQSLAAVGGRIYFAGHDHFYARARVDLDPAEPAFYQVIIGTAGAPPYVFDHVYGGDNGDASVTDEYSDTPYGYLLVEIQGPHATITWKKLVSISPIVFESMETFCYTLGE